MASSKLFVVKFKIGYSDDFSVLKAFAGRLSAQQYVESEVKRLLKDKYDPGGGCWTDAWNYRYEDALRTDDRDGNPRTYDYSFEIEEVDVERDVVLPELPFVERESLALKAENKERAEEALANAGCAWKSAAR